ncbi:citrate synthase/methylcitrate synthase [Cohnella thermotolerans]|uniref:citrate synthase/methylcitrate synthase n=1 Tax=Cohnella thermotolerans TaxID=329858 RepID=UPI00041750CC|nr:citrate synthase/methylcitrate synthase [Cohnella thermotolerans]
MAKATGLEGIVAAETAIGHVDGEKGKLVYRGHWARDLAVSRSFEEAAYLLWHGSLPDARQLETFSRKLAAARTLTPELRRLLDAIPAGTPPMNAMAAAVAAIAKDDPAWPPTIDQAIRLTGLLPVVIAYRHRRANGLPWPEEADERDHVAHYLHLLFGRPPEPAHVRAMSAYMILTMEHGLNASTFAARVVASTESDLCSAVAAAIGAMKGPLHGGAPSGVIRLLEDIGSKERAEEVMRGLLERGERLMGFGHRVYKTRDPRADALREVTAGLAGDDPWLDLAQHAERTAIRLLEQYKPGRKLYTNVEFYAAAVLRAVRMPPELFTPTFSAARIVGWTAHALEQSANNRIYRPQSVYSGPWPEDGNAAGTN